MIDASIALYNQLLQPSEIRLVESSVRTAAHAVAPLIERFDATNFVAISLIHRHFVVKEGEVVAWANEAGELRLRPRPHALSRFAPVTWGLSPDNKITAIEYASVDLFPPAVMSFVNSKDFPRFKAELLGKLQASPLGSHAGISISPTVFSNFFTSAHLASGQAYEETFDKLSNSTRIVPRADKFEGWNLMGTKDVISTMWSIRGGKPQMLAGCGGCCKIVDGPC